MFEVNPTSRDSIAVLTTSRIGAILHAPGEHLTGLEMMRLVERNHQRITDLENTVAQLRAVVEHERKCRRALSARLDRDERVDLSEVW